MGVKNLWKLLSPCGKRVSMEHKTLAIDTSIWIYQYRNIPQPLIVFSFCRRLFRILYSQIKPIFIFDGTPPPIKQERLEARKKANEKLLLRSYLKNKKCSVCGKGVGECDHLNEVDFEKLNNDAFEKIKNHDYNWGEVSDENELEEYFKAGSKRYLKQEIIDNSDQEFNELNEFSNKLKSDEPMDYCDNSIANFDQSVMENLSKTKQLAILIDLRLKRKLPMMCDTSTSFNFSNSQIENVKKRNKITSLIKGLNKDANQTIQSDCTTRSVLTKEKSDVDIFKNFCCIEDAKCQKSESKTDQSIEDLFKLDQEDKWESSYEKYKEMPNAPANEDKRIDLNSKLLNNLNPDKYHHGLPDFKVASLSTADILSKEFSKESKVSSSEESCDFNLLNEYLNDTSDESLAENREKEFNALRVNREVAISNASDSSDIKLIKALFIEILKVFEIPFIESIGETDPQCWELFKNGLIDGVISEDSDMIIYGTTVYKNFFRKDKNILEFAMADVENEMGLTQDDLIKVAYLLGSDYSSGINGIGLKRVIDKITTVNEFDVKFLNEIYKEDENVIKLNELVFGSLNKNKFRSFLISKGLHESKVEELLLYMDKVKEVQSES